MFGAFLLAVPVAFTYVRTRTRVKFDRSLIQTVIVLPVVVTAMRPEHAADRVALLARTAEQAVGVRDAVLTLRALRALRIASLARDALDAADHAVLDR
jgi:hypothetical protein